MLYFSHFLFTETRSASKGNWRKKRRKFGGSCTDIRTNYYHAFIESTAAQAMRKIVKSKPIYCKNYIKKEKAMGERENQTNKSTSTFFISLISFTHSFHFTLSHHPSAASAAATLHFVFHFRFTSNFPFSFTFTKVTFYAY